MDIFGIRSAADVRAFLYVLTPVVLAWLVSLGVLDNNASALWLGLATAVLSPLLATANTVAGFRRWFYGVITATQAVLVGLGIFTDNQVTPVVAIIVAVIGAGVAAANTPTTGADHKV